MSVVTILHRFLTSLSFTVVVETFVLFVLLTYVFRKRELTKLQIIEAGFFATFSTIPYVWFVFPYILAWPGGVVYWSEPFAFIVEAIFYKLFLRLEWRVALAVSLLCNATSFFLGPLLRAHGLWVYW